MEWYGHELLFFKCDNFEQEEIEEGFTRSVKEWISLLLLLDAKKQNKSMQEVVDESEIISIWQKGTKATMFQIVFFMNWGDKWCYPERNFQARMWVNLNNISKKKYIQFLCSAFNIHMALLPWMFLIGSMCHCSHLVALSIILSTS